jgi:hypothetical protein
MTPKTLSRYNSQWPEVQIFYHIYSSQNALELYLVKDLYTRYVVLDVFSMKK